MEYDNDKLTQLFLEKMSGASDSFNERLRIRSQEKSPEEWVLEDLRDTLAEMDKRLEIEAEERKCEDAEVLKYTKKINRRSFLVSLFTLAVSVAALLVAVVSLYVSVLQVSDDPDNSASYSDATQEDSDNR